MTPRATTYLAATLIGLAAMLAILPPPALWGAGPLWDIPIPDQAQALAGHLAFQADQWRWPLLSTERLFWPRGLSIVLTDSNPLFSLLAKAWARSTGQGPSNWLGAFLGLCWFLQAIAAAYAARGLRVSPPAAIAAAILACAWPALIHRTEHINLCAHALILFALGLAFRRIEHPKRWWPATLLLVVAILTQPYMFQLCAVILAAIPLHAALTRRPRWKTDAACYLASGLLAFATLRILGGPLSGGDRGFTFFSMNLLSPLWPQRSGVFGPDLPILDPTGGQYEGFNWLGAGTILLLLAALAQFAWRRTRPRPALALVLILGGLALLSLSSRIYAGPYKLLDLGNKPWEDIFGTFRASGRAFWPTGYAIMLGAVAAADRLRPRLAFPLLAAAALLQLIDVRPLRDEARAWWLNGYGAVLPPVPAGTTLLALAPFPGCAPAPEIKMGGPIMGLDAVRHGARLASIGLGRSPEWFSCETVLSDALELPLLPHETRVFYEPSLPTPLQPVLLGPDAICRRTLGFVLCARDAPPFPGDLLPPGPTPAIIGLGWKPAPDALWSEGPHSTLLLPPGIRRLHLRLAGLATAPGQTRTIQVTIGRLPPRAFDLPDAAPTTIDLDLPPETTRIAFNTRRPVDPTRRALAAPVRRAAIRLLAATAEDAEGRDVPLPGLFASAPQNRP